MEEDDGSTNQSIISNNQITASNGSSYVGIFNSNNVHIIKVVQAQGGCEGNEGFLKHKAETIAWGAAPQLPPPVVGLDFPLKELKRKLLKDEVSMLVLTAPGGCGKTTLATTFCQDQEVKEIFRDNIFFVIVSRNSNLEHIVQQLYKRRVSKLPTFQNEVDTVRWLHYFLREEAKNPLLLVLDDVWPGSESLLEKFDQFSMPNCKLLVTSRSEFRRFGSSYHLQSLDYDNAMKLFDHSASLGDKSSHIPQYLSRQNGLDLNFAHREQMLLGSGSDSGAVNESLAASMQCGALITNLGQRLLARSQEVQALKSQVTTLRGMLSDADQQIRRLRKRNKDLEGHVFVLQIPEEHRYEEHKSSPVDA